MGVVAQFNEFKHISKEGLIGGFLQFVTSWLLVYRK